MRLEGTTIAPRSDVRPLLLLAPLGLALVPSIAPAKPAQQATSKVVESTTTDSQLLFDLVDRERAPLTQLHKDVVASLYGSALPHPPNLVDATSALDCEHAKHDITLDPNTGATTATLELRVKAKGKAISAVGLTIDEGLEIGKVTASDRSASAVDSVFAPTRVVRVDLSPALEPGTETVLTVPYSGTLSCGASPDTGTVVCSKGGDFSYFAHQSIFPYIFDPDAPSSFELDGLTRDIVLRVPSSLDVVATGQKVSEAIDGENKVSTWTVDKPLSRIVGLYAFAGKLGKKPVTGRAVPTMLVFPTPEKTIDEDLALWSSPALDFVEKMSGNKLPFNRSLSLVRLPQAIRDPGTATFGMTLLSDSYARAGDLMYEETWAHENSHLFWGIVVPETDSFESRLMSEGMATLTEIEYTHQRHFASEDRDAYLARRFLPMGLDLRMAAADLPPVQLAPGMKLPDEFRTKLYTLWAYYKTSTTLDHLRVTVGEDVFSSALDSYIQRCRYVGCRPDALREEIERKTGKDLRPFFDRWVTASERPEVLVGFTPTTTGADIELTKPDDRPMTLELWLSLANGETLKQRIDMGPRTSRAHVDTPSPVLRVSASPRHDVLVNVRSAVTGDLDFDGETDGFDILRCARQIGRTYTSKGAAGLWNVTETFDPRCDVDGNLAIDDDDLARLAESFGKLRAR
jgi:hypothetical protein